MMKKPYSILTLILPALAFCGCSKSPEDGDITITISDTIVITSEAIMTTTTTTTAKSTTTTPKTTTTTAKSTTTSAAAITSAVTPAATTTAAATTAAATAAPPATTAAPATTTAPPATTTTPAATTQTPPGEVTLELEEARFSEPPTRLKLTLTNYTSKEILTGHHAYIEHFSGGEWAILYEPATDDEGYTLRPGESLSFSLYLSPGEVQYPDGLYRVVKPDTGSSAEFVIG